MAHYFSAGIITCPCSSVYPRYTCSRSKISYAHFLKSPGHCNRLGCIARWECEYVHKLLRLGKCYFGGIFHQINFFHLHMYCIVYCNQTGLVFFLSVNLCTVFLIWNFFILGITQSFMK